MHAEQSLTFAALVVVVALACGLALMRLRQPAIVGYIVAGVVLGPSGLGLIQDRAQVAGLAELGVLMLLFLIGMELSLRAFTRVLGIALFGAAAQIAVALAVMLALTRVLGWHQGLAVLLAFVVSLSSTAVAIKMLDDIGELRSRIGQRAVGVLIAQDLAVVPMMLVLNALASESGLDLAAALPMALAVAFLVGYVWFLSRRQRLRLPFGEWIAAHHDLAPLAALAYCFAAATASGLLGLSPAYGAFLAGLLVGSSIERQAMIAATHPIQSVLLMVFFLSIGLLIDLGYIWTHLASVLVLLLVVTLGKTAINVAILRLLGEPWPSAFLIGVVLGQVGEFSFVLAAVGLGNGLIGEDGYRLVVTIIALSLVISPLWLDAARRLDALAASGVAGVGELVRVAYGRETAAVGTALGKGWRGVRRAQAACARLLRRPAPLAETASDETKPPPGDA